MRLFLETSTTSVVQQGNCTLALDICWPCPVFPFVLYYSILRNNSIFIYQKLFWSQSFKIPTGVKICPIYPEFEQPRFCINSVDKNCSYCKKYSLWKNKFIKGLFLIWVFWNSRNASALYFFSFYSSTIFFHWDIWLKFLLNVVTFTF